MGRVEPLLELNGLSVHFAGLRALSDVTFTAKPGEVRAVIGPNGAGKTTLFNAITGFVRATQGTVRFKGKEIQGLSPHIISAKGVRRTFQNGGLFGEMTVLENVLTGLHTGIKSGFLSTILGTRKAAAAERAAVAKARDLLDLMGIRDLEDQTVKDISGGQQRMVEITRALSTGAPLLMLDEPAVGLTPPARDQLMNVIRKLAAERGICILLIEHSIDMVMKNADIIVVLNGGQVIAEGASAEIRQNREVIDAYLGYATNSA